MHEATACTFSKGIGIYGFSKCSFCHAAADEATSANSHSNVSAIPAIADAARGFSESARLRQSKRHRAESCLDVSVPVRSLRPVSLPTAPPVRLGDTVDSHFPGHQDHGCRGKIKSSAPPSESGMQYFAINFGEEYDYVIEHPLDQLQLVGPLPY